MGGSDQINMMSAPIVGSPSAGWDVVAAADFDANGSPDLILQNRTSNAASIWYMSGDQGATVLSAPIFGYPAQIGRSSRSGTSIGMACPILFYKTR